MFIWLFGCRFETDGSKQYRALATDPRFSIAVSLVMRRATVSIAAAPFFGPASGAPLEGEWECDVHGGEIVLLGRTATRPAACIFSKPLSQSAESVRMQLMVAPAHVAPHTGIVLTAADENMWLSPLAPLKTATSFVARNLVGAGPRIEQRFQTVMYWAAEAAPATMHWQPLLDDQQSGLLVIDTHFKEPGPTGLWAQNEQFLGLQRGSFDGSTGTLTIDSEVERASRTYGLNQDFHKGLLVNIDILDPDAAPFESNHLLAHQMLANGMLRQRIVYNVDDPGQPDTECNWVPKTVLGETCLIAFGLTDEFGLPLALVRDSFPLTSRAGVTSARIEDELHLSNASIQISHPHEQQLKVIVRSIRPDSVDIDSALPDPRYLDWLFGAQGLIELTTKAPTALEIHGFSNGAYLRWSGAGMLEAKIDCEPFEYSFSENFPSFIFSRLVFPTKTGLTLHVQSHEREYSLLEKSGNTTGRVCEISSDENQAEFSLPLFDYNYAFVNCANAGLAAMVSANSKPFLIRAARWLDKLNLASARAFALDEPVDQIHQSGFVRSDKEKAPPQLLGLFGWPAGEARVVEQSVALASVAPNPLTIASRGSPIIGAATSLFIHGGTKREELALLELSRQMEKAASVKSLLPLLAPQPKLADLFTKFAALWNCADLPNLPQLPAELPLIGDWNKVRAALLLLRERVAFGGTNRRFPPPSSNGVDPLLLAVAELRRILRGEASWIGYDKAQLRILEQKITAHVDGALILAGDLPVAAAKLRNFWELLPKTDLLYALLCSITVPGTRAVFGLALEALTDQKFVALAMELPGFDDPAVTDLRQIGTMLTSVAQGLPSEIETLEKLWREQKDLVPLLKDILPATDVALIVKEIEALRLSYGTKLATSVYARLLAEASAGRLSNELWHLFAAWTKTYAGFEKYALFGELKSLWNAKYPAQELKKWDDYALDAAWDFKRIEQLFSLKAGLNFQKLAIEMFAKFRFEPPEYLLFSERLPLQTRANELVGQLWNHAFPLAMPGANWDFMFDNQATIILKLSGKRKLRDLLLEAAKTNASPAIPDPLGVVVDAETPDEALRNLLAKIDPQVLDDASWRGIVVIRPTLDLGRHQQLRDLLGLRHFEMDYVAIGGIGKDAVNTLNTYAYVKHSRTQEKITDVQKTDPGTDIALALVKFEAQIRNATLVRGEVVLNLYLTNLWGKSDPSANKKIVVIKGKIPEDAGAGAFEFSAELPKPVSFDINVAFIEKFLFKGMKVGTHDGKTSVEIDGDIAVKDWGEYIKKGDKPITLQDFRILLPAKNKGDVTRMGENRWLQFDFPSIHIPFPGAKAVSLMAHIDIRPEGVGFVREAAREDGSPSDVYKGLIDSHVWLFQQPPTTGLKKGTVIPYVNFSVSFGKLPQFGGTSLDSLKFNMLIGILQPALPALPTQILGISSLDATKLKLDIFGVLKLQLEQLYVGAATYGKPLAARNPATIIAARDVRLSICGWEPFKKLNLLMAQYGNGKDANSAFLMTADATAGDGGGTVKLNWIVLGRNIELPQKDKDYLFEGKKSGATDELFKNVIKFPPETKLLEIAQGKAKTAPTIAGGTADILVDLGTDNAWLFALRGSIGAFVEDLVLVFHDQRYYGIRLKGSLIETIIGKDTLEMAYIPGETRDQDRFRTTFRIPALSFIAQLEAGEFGIEWGLNWSFLLDFFFPWKRNGAYLWDRAARMPMGTYEAKFGFYFERRVAAAPEGAKYITLAAGVGFYVGYYWGLGSPGSGVWVRAGIGVFAILEGAVTLLSPALKPGELPGMELLRTSVKSLEVIGVVGIYAYAEGGIRIWILSASIVASVQAAIAAHLLYIPSGGSTLSYRASLAANYAASCRVGSGFFSWTFSVSGEYAIEANGCLCLS
ncbi:hypothetical protein LNV09_07485 [Paucibacter sp. B2R-40]|uniref:hypothetical protein n=1 Tax=Paucibacter sp. B2R-40 TaxID=2893554 RepID=UPI0021E3FA5D|nr:hypothetical protein [Paucibacter sp. B2R-40]MCV2354007.1 hypothetical protein [Paucibacter sp. B2R-40]